jgi:hypothetical protein
MITDAGELMLLPSPVNLEFTGGTFALPDDYSPTLNNAPNLKPEEYKLEINTSGINIYSSTPVGARYAGYTLAQITDCCKNMLPTLKIHDYPAFAKRAVMLDVSRGRIWNMEHFKAIFRKLASWKINHVQLYFEASFASSGNEEIWHNDAFLNSLELQELNEYAHKYGIELSPCQNSFGHLTRFLISDSYRHLAEIPPGSGFEAWGKLTAVPQSLCPEDPGSLEFIQHIISELAPNFSSSIFNLGCDETIDLGLGRSRKTVIECGIDKVFTDYVNKLCAVVRKMGLKPAVWADFIQKNPESIQLLPPEMLYLVWGYDKDTPFNEWCRLMAKNQCDFWVCPGTSCWSSFFGDSYRRHCNLKLAAVAGTEYNASGYMITEWGDGGHRQLWPPTLYALAEGAQSAWNASCEFMPEHAGYRAFGSCKLGRWLENAGNLERGLRDKGINTLFQDMHTPLFSFNEKNKPVHTSFYREIEYKLAKLAGAIPQDLPDLLTQELQCLVKLADIAVKRACLRREGRLENIKKLVPDMRKGIAEFRELWMARSKPESLSASVSKDETVADEMERCF